jgi:hypothetical protein
MSHSLIENESLDQEKLSIQNLSFQELLDEFAREVVLLQEAISKSKI